MPNTPSTIGKGMTVWCCTSDLTTGDRESISKLLNTFGKAIHVDDEKFVDMSTAISGSGPACKLQHDVNFKRYRKEVCCL